MGDTFVLKSMIRDDPEWHAKKLQYGDTTDMTANVYYDRTVSYTASAPTSGRIFNIAGRSLQEGRAFWNMCPII